MSSNCSTVFLHILMANVFEVRSSGVITTTTHDLIHFGGVKTAVLSAKKFKKNSRKCKRNSTRTCTILYSASVFGMGSSHDCKKIRNYQTVLFFAAPWCALVLIDLELPGDDGLIHSNSDSVWTSVGNVNWCMNGQLPNNTRPWRPGTS